MENSQDRVTSFSYQPVDSQGLICGSFFEEACPVVLSDPDVESTESYPTVSQITVPFARPGPAG
jgi:hypothetical protein